MKTDKELDELEKQRRICDLKLKIAILEKNDKAKKRYLDKSNKLFDKMLKSK